LPSGIIIIDKPAGWTSHDVVAKLRRVYCERRIGHAGTLDPMATGVLPVFIGRATRAVEFAAETDKEYLAGLRLGVTTDTQDITGAVLETRSVNVTRTQLEDMLLRFTGPILQTPPMYSALKVGGKPLYKLAREGKEVARLARPVTIYALKLLEQANECDYIFLVSCSKGTYVRTLCHDLGQALGCGGILSSLRRTRAAGFALDSAVTMEAVLSHPDPQSLLLSVDRYFDHYPSLNVDAEAEKKIRNGAAIPSPGADGEFRIYGPGGFLMLGRRSQNQLSVIKRFFEV